MTLTLKQRASSQLYDTYLTAYDVPDEGNRLDYTTAVDIISDILGGERNEATQLRLIREVVRLTNHLL